MIPRRNIASLLLVSVFTVGTVVSPFAHYSYMVLAEWGSDGGDSMHHAMSGHLHHGPALSTSVSSSSCNYWDLVGTMLSVQPEASESPIRIAEPGLLDELVHEQFNGLLVHSTLSIRGPPAA